MSDRPVPLRPLERFQGETARLVAGLQASVDALQRLGTEEASQAASEIQAIIDDIRDALGEIPEN